MSSRVDKLPHAFDEVEGDSDIVHYWKRELENRFNCVDVFRMTLSGMSLNTMSDAVPLRKCLSLDKNCLVTNQMDSIAYLLR